MDGRLPGITRLLLGFALAWSVLLVVAGGLIPVVSFESIETSADGSVTTATGSSSLIAAEGRGVLLVLAVPLIVTLLVTIALLQRRRRGATVVAWTLTGILCAFTLMALMSIGIAIVPVAAALVVACATAAPRRTPAPDAAPAGVGP